MARSTIRVAMQLFAVCLAATISVSAQERTTPAASSQFETAVTLPSAGPTENLCQTPDGSIYITGIDDRILWKISPKGDVEKFATIPSMVAILGVAPYKGGFVLTAFQKSFRRPPPTLRDLSDVGPAVLVLDKTGNLVATIPGEKGQAFNGIAEAGKGWYLAADSNASSLWRVDPAKKRIELWLKDDQLSPTGTPAIGANGIKVHDGWVYVSVTAHRAIYRVQIGSHGKPKGALSLFAQGLRPEDFGVAKDGTIYAPTGNSIDKISPTGEVSKFLDGVPGGPSALVDKSGKWLYWPTRGGKDPQRLLKAAIK